MNEIFRNEALKYVPHPSNKISHLKFGNQIEYLMKDEQFNSREFEEL